MALEQEIAALRDEIQKLNAVTTKLLEARTDAIETVRAAAAPEKKAADKPKVTEKAEAPKEEAKKPAPESLSSPLADDDFTDAGLKTHVAKYINHGVTAENPMTKEEREARMEKVRGVLAHEKIAAATVAEVPQKLRKAFRKKIADYITEIDESGWLTAATEVAEAAEEEEL